MAWMVMGVSCIVLMVPGRLYGQEGVQLFGGIDIWGVVAVPRSLDGRTEVTTQPSLGNQLVVNHVVVGVVWSQEAVQARLAVQEGAFTRANYTGADSSWRMLHEASMRINAGNGWVVEAGVLPSTIGFESMTSWNNPTVSRSLIADHTPYYMLGIHGRWERDSTFGVGVVFMNGWQQIVDVNRQPALGTTLFWRVLDGTTLAVNTFAGAEPQASGAASMRYHVNTIVTHSLGDATRLYGLLDVTLQDKQPVGTANTVYVGLQARHSLSEVVSVCLRAEHASDPHRLLYRFGMADRFEVSSASANVDVLLRRRLGWRTEVRGFRATNPMFAAESNTEPRRWYAMVVSGLSMWL